MPLRHEFTEPERDALTELVNIGVSRAAVALSRLIRREVLLSVPAMSIGTAMHAAALIGGTAERLTAVRQRFRGGIKGQAVLLFPQADSLALAKLVEDQLAAGEPADDLATDALRETGNIVLQSCLAALANLFRQSLQIGPPEVVEVTAQELFPAPSDVVLVVYMDFQVREPRVRGYVALLMDLPEIGRLRELVAEFIRKAEGK